MANALVSMQIILKTPNGEDVIPRVISQVQICSNPEGASMEKLTEKYR